MKALSRLLVALALILLSVPVFAMTSSDLELLKKELGSNISADLVRDLNARDLLPASKFHDGVPIWNPNEGLADGGSVAIIAPTAARVGLELQRLRERGVLFADTPTVQRFMALKDAWLRLVTTPNFRRAVGLLDTTVRQSAKNLRQTPNGAMLNAVIQRRSDLVRGTQINEVTLAARPDFWLAIEPKPGELQCFLLLYGRWTSPGVWTCSQEGSNCSVQVPCRQ